MRLTQEAKVLLALGIGTLVVIIGAVFLLSKNTTPNSTNNGADQKSLTQNAKHIISAENAKVTVTEFADYQCPACAAANPALSEIKKEYAGRVSFVYRHFPLPQHRNAMSSIYAAEAAGEQGKFWEMSDLLYAKQGEWSDLENPEQTYLSYASSLQLDQVKFTEDFKSKKYDSQIQTDLQDARSIGVNSTPTIYINNQKYKNSVTVQNLKSVIDKELNN